MPRTIVVLVKYVPDAGSARTFDPADHTTVRSGDGLLSELDEYAVEAALALAESGDWTVTAMTMGPEAAATAVKKALQMGADAGVHVCDDGLAGTDALGTSLVLSAAIGKLGAEAGAPVDLVLCGMASTDGAMSVVPAMLAARLGVAGLTFAAELAVEGDTVRIRRDSEVASETVVAELPALVSVTDQINEPRYPSFKGIMAAKKKPVSTWTLADLGVDAGTVGAAGAATTVVEVTARPPRGAGTVITDDGDGGTRLAEFLAAQKFI